MDKVSILKKIIEDNGSCCWAKPSICAKCPLSQLKKKQDDSGWMSCIESVCGLNIDNLSEEEMDTLYKTHAERLLLDYTIENILKEDNSAE